MMVESEISREKIPSQGNDFETSCRNKRGGWGEPIKHIEDKEWANQIINLSKNVQHKLSK